MLKTLQSKAMQLLTLWNVKKQRKTRPITLNLVEIKEFTENNIKTIDTLI